MKLRGLESSQGSEFALGAVSLCFPFRTDVPRLECVSVTYEDAATEGRLIVVFDTYGSSGVPSMLSSLLTSWADIS